MPRARRISYSSLTFHRHRNGAGIVTLAVRSTRKKWRGDGGVGAAGMADAMRMACSP